MNTIKPHFSIYKLLLITDNMFRFPREYSEFILEYQVGKPHGTSFRDYITVKDNFYELIF